jgi:hypothetical protein
MQIDHGLILSQRREQRRREREERQRERARKLNQLLDAMRRGAMLHRSNGWRLIDGFTTIRRVDGHIVRAALKRGAITGNGDSLFTDVPSQTWKWNGGDDTFAGAFKGGKK